MGPAHLCLSSFHCSYQIWSTSLVWRRLSPLLLRRHFQSTKYISNLINKPLGILVHFWAMKLEFHSINVPNPWSIRIHIRIERGYNFSVGFNHQELTQYMDSRPKLYIGYILNHGINQSLVSLISLRSILFVHIVTLHYFFVRPSYIHILYT